jgi:hypothetical protein
MEQTNNDLEHKTQEISVSIVREASLCDRLYNLPAGYEIRANHGDNGGSYDCGYSVVRRPVSGKLREKFPCLNNVYKVVYTTFEPMKKQERYALGQKRAEHKMLEKARYVAEKAMEYHSKRLEEEL